MNTKKVAILASGEGSNAKNISLYFRHHPRIDVVLIASDQPKANVIQHSKSLNISSLVFSKTCFSLLEKKLDALNIDLIVLAGFLSLIPLEFVTKFSKKIINIHPSLLPKYGGKGMYGMAVHKAVISNNEAQTGISIHYVNEVYDDGQVIFQAKCAINPSETPNDIAKKVHELEYKHYPKVIEHLLLEQSY